MNKPSALMLPASVGLMLLASSLASYSESRKPQTPVGQSALETQAIAQLAHYRQWKRVNSKPYYMHSAVAAMCAPASPAMMQAEQGNPHVMRYATVYVNALGRKAMMQQEHPKFPIGTIILKEKQLGRKGRGIPQLTSVASEDQIERSRPDANTAPELMTVMIKREAGYNPAHGDWEYLTLNGADGRVLTSGKLTTCQNCHAAQKQDDFVFRNYLSEDARGKRP